MTQKPKPDYVFNVWNDQLPIPIKDTNDGTASAAWHRDFNRISMAHYGRRITHRILVYLKDKRA